MVICKFLNSDASDRFCDSLASSGEILATYHLPGKGSFCLINAPPPAKVDFALFDGSVEQAQDILSRTGWQGILDRQSAAA